jgi:hypothetical protein
MKNLLIAILMISPCIHIQLAYGATEVVAHSISTRNIARQESQFSSGNSVLVVCRSNLNWPLNSAYRTIDALDRDAASQPNISGGYFHVYSYEINSDGSVTKRRHKKFKAD